MNSMTRRIPSLVLTLVAICVPAVGGCEGDDVAANPVVDAGPPRGPGDASSLPEDYAVLVRGALFTPDMAAAQVRHDAIAGGGREAAQAAGDYGHDVLLGTTMLGTPENQFAALDRWADIRAAQAFYGDPMIAGAFATLFAAPPTLETFQHKLDWTGWGSLDVFGETEPHYFVVARGHLAASTTLESRDAHNALVGATAGMARMAGDATHVVYLGTEDPREFLAIDVWAISDPIVPFYSNPDFARGIGSLFDAPPTIGVYQGTSWAQW